VKKTVITHFFNEERMLRWWLPHHIKLFEDGILINHHSTDASVDVCKSLAPHWKVVNSRLDEFGAVENDAEVMKYEEKIDGWKMVLNATEFLVCNPAILDRILKDMRRKDQRCLKTCGVVMVDTHPEQAASTDKPLVHQKHHGYVEEEVVYSGKPLGRLRMQLYKWQLRAGLRQRTAGLRNRIMHSYETGAYSPGRHYTTHSVDINAESIFTFWYGFSPWDSEMIARKQQFEQRIPQEDRKYGRGAQHLWNLAKLQEVYRSNIPKARDVGRLVPASEE